MSGQCSTSSKLRNSIFNILRAQKLEYSVFLLLKNSIFNILRFQNSINSIFQYSVWCGLRRFSDFFSVQFCSAPNFIAGFYRDGTHTGTLDGITWFRACQSNFAVVQFWLASLWLVLVVCVDKVLKIYWSSAMLLPLL